MTGMSPADLTALAGDIARRVGVKAERNARLLDAVSRGAAARSRRLAGRVVEVLVDGTSRKNAGELTGRTRCNRVLNFDGRGLARPGALVDVRVDEVLPHSLRGTIASEAEEASDSE